MSVSKLLKIRVYMKTDGVCYYCRRQLVLRRKNHREPVTIDHYIPLSRGGFDEFENMVPACRKCNNAKADLLPEEFDIKRNESK